ncbi:MAG: tRNA dimethylallyltransferase [candidate division WWE3 bacterium GW2011_GWA1_46_21]|uniref:tRNA dimethylallyltransferase n=3 Tax=Katanobacteria TaxID=422282 RepID=A0A0G1SE16_UNCKA|nr:MAG: tRNA dimethylallyltransferase [candidate division WWE3 bacterium GW2011_GWA1_46_21]KKU51496.1 MAG: tRNA dimethylallyltransferase [candidate division WWE3 bacterium GW2011_GWC1_47_10]KKU57867.1 MAG: tRNA dimethylallyltransferase [candidate division WWE3 bacterium GW2011_GWB1_47_11]
MAPRALNGDLGKNPAKICIIVGPTCSGKTSAALRLSKKLGGEIVSADSRQVFKFMDIGTGKIPMGHTGRGPEFVRGAGKWLVDGVPVWGYDLAVPGDYFSAYDWAKWALSKIAEITKRGKRVFVVGGTGFYIDVLAGRRVLAGQKPDFAVRKSLESMPTKNLLTWLTSLNLAAGKRVDKNNRRRIVRELEKELTKEKARTTPLPYLRKENFALVGLTADKPILYARVDAWLNEIWQNGLVEETAKLIALGFADTQQLNGLIYKTTKDYIQKNVGDAAAKERIKFDLHAYIRRQLTWFNQNDAISWLDTNAQNFGEKLENLVL